MTANTAWPTPPIILPFDRNSDVSYDNSKILSNLDKCIGKDSTNNLFPADGKGWAVCGLPDVSYHSVLEEKVAPPPPPPPQPKQSKLSCFSRNKENVALPNTPAQTIDRTEGKRLMAIVLLERAEYNFFHGMNSGRTILDDINLAEKRI